MQIRLLTIATLLCCACSCTLDETPFSVPDIPAADRHESVDAQLLAARTDAVGQPESADALGHFGMTLQAYGLHDQAELVHARARTLDPDNFRWAYLHAYSLEVLGRYEQAADAFAAAANIDPREGTTRLGAALLELGETERAREHLLRALSFNESDARALYELGRLEIRAGNLALARDYLVRAVETGAEHPSIYYALADLSSRQGDAENAAAYRERFEILNAKSVRWPDPMLAEVAALSLSDRSLMAEALRAIQNNDIRRAISLNEQARELNPDNPLPPAALIGLYAIVGDNEKSDEALLIARDLDPDSAQFHYNVGLARMAQNRLADAETAMLRVTEIDPQGSLAWTKLADIYVARGERGKAIDAFASAYERAPSNDELRLKLGVLYAQTGQYESALAVLEAAAATDADEARRLWAIGRSHRYLGHPELASDALKQARSAAIRAGEGRLAQVIGQELAKLDAIPES